MSIIQLTAQFIDFVDIHLETDEQPEELYQRLMAFTEDSLLKANVLTHHGKDIVKNVLINQLTASLSNCYFDNFQSGYRANHSTVTAFIKVLNDIHFNIDTGKTQILVLLDLSAG